MINTRRLTTTPPFVIAVIATLIYISIIILGNTSIAFADNDTDSGDSDYVFIPINDKVVVYNYEDPTCSFDNSCIFKAGDKIQIDGITYTYRDTYEDGDYDSHPERYIWESENGLLPSNYSIEAIPEGNINPAYLNAGDEFSYSVILSDNGSEIARITGLKAELGTLYHTAWIDGVRYSIVRTGNASFTVGAHGIKGNVRGHVDILPKADPKSGSNDNLTEVTRVWYDNPKVTSITIPETVTDIQGAGLKDIVWNYESAKYTVAEGTPIPGFTIYGKPGSYAQEYANKYGFEFKEISEESSYYFVPINDKVVVYNYEDPTCSFDNSCIFKAGDKIQIDGITYTYRDTYEDGDYDSHPERYIWKSENGLLPSNYSIEAIPEGNINPAYLNAGDEFSYSVILSDNGNEIARITGLKAKLGTLYHTAWIDGVRYSIVRTGKNTFTVGAHGINENVSGHVDILPSVDPSNRPDTDPTEVTRVWYDNPRVTSITIPETVTDIQGVGLKDIVWNYESLKYTVAEGTPISGFIVYGKAGSYAQEYANKYGFEFKEIKEKTPETNPDSNQNSEFSAGTKKVVNGAAYEMMDSAAHTVRLIKAANKKSFSIPSTINWSGEAFMVSEIGSKAFTGKKIRSVTIGKNVKKIKKNAFKGSSATKVIVKTKKLKKASVKGSLRGSKIKNVKVKVGNKSQNRKYVKKYKKIFTKKNVGRKVLVK